VKNIFAKKHTVILFVTLFILSSEVLPQNNNRLKPAADTARYKKNPSYELQYDLFNLYKTRQADIVMLGNSLTAGANWGELLNRANVVSRAIPGDILEGFSARMDQVLKLKPKIVFVMGGLNDIYSWIPVDVVFSNYMKILTMLKSNDITPVIQLTTYVTRNYAKEWGGTPEVNFGRNREVDKLNKLLSEYARNNNIDVIDLLPSIATRDGYLKPELTWDGVHFKADAYRIWVREVENILRKYKM
jgi:lysophospholipase L1-like esterase